MKIKRIIEQHRRDFTAIYECEHCGHEHKAHGYDDGNFHRNVVPKMACQSCGRTAPEDFRPMGAKYPEGQVV